MKTSFKINLGEITLPTGGAQDIILEGALEYSAIELAENWKLIKTIMQEGPDVLNGFASNIRQLRDNFNTEVEEEC